MKRIVSGNELYEKMSDAINLLCGTVKTTLGPVGNNVIVDHSTFSPFITNDGVTIAENIQSDDEVVNTILELAKEASIKTNENVGDGTTTTLVLLECIFNLGLDLIKNGKKPIILKQELNNKLNDIIKYIGLKKKNISNENLINIATNSSNDNEIGKLISEVYMKVKDKNAINIKETDIPITKVEYLKGYSFETNVASPYFFNNTKELNYDNSKILITNNEINDIELLGDIINDVIKSNYNLVIIAKDYDEYFVNQILSLNLDNNLNILLLKHPLYGIMSNCVLNDISVITNAKIIETNVFNTSYLGNIDKLVCNNEICRLEFKISNEIKKYINKLKKDLKYSLDMKEFISKRISMFKYGCANIYVGGTTKLERIEKRMRFDDALCALSVTNNGIVAGSGIVFLEISDKLNKEKDIDFLYKETLSKPFEQILINAGLDALDIHNKIKNANYSVLYNVKTLQYENINETKIIDPYDVLIDSLKNAVSIAGILLTTSSLVINEQINNLNKLNDYNEI